jgi:D-alanyl-D-alanine carboxypeptidase (penicillin-binding protein 5/6)
LSNPEQISTSTCRTNRTSFYSLRTIPLTASRHLFSLLLCCAAFFLVGFGPPRLTDRELAPTRRLAPAELRRWSETRRPPEISADALIVYDVDAEQILFERAMNESLPMASLTKLMTALLVWEANAFDDVVTVEATDLVGGASMGLIAGDALKVEELLWGLLVPSGNDAAMALARHVGGSMDAFVARMNERAAELGLDATSFRNPHGFDAPGHLSSAADLLALTLRTRTLPGFSTMVATSETTVAGYPMQNTNDLLVTEPDATGIKTGTTPLAGQCLIAEFDNGAGHRVIIEVLGSTDRYQDALRLRQYYAENYEWLSGDATQLSQLNRLHDGDGRLWYVQATGPAPSTLVRRGEYPALQGYRRIARPPEGTPWLAGIEVGTLEWRLGTELVGVQRLELR